MCKINCSILKDLVPSYLDNLCSKESRRAIDAHLAECSECRDYTESLKQTEIVADQSDQNSLFFMKKVKRYYSQRNALGAALLYLLVLFVLPALATLQPNSETELHYILMVILSLGTCLLLSNYQTRPKSSLPAVLSAVSAGLGALYAAGLMAVLYNCLKNETSFFGITLERMGPILNMQYIALVILQLLTFAACAVYTVRTECAFGILPSLNLICCAFCFSCRNLLFFMDSKSTLLRAIWHNIAVFLLTAAGIALAESVLLKIRIYFEKKIFDPF